MNSTASTLSFDITKEDHRDRYSCVVAYLSENVHDESNPLVLDTDTESDCRHCGFVDHMNSNNPFNLIFCFRNELGSFKVKIFLTACPFYMGGLIFKICILLIPMYL